MDHGEKRLMDKSQESLFVRLIPFFERYGILLLILIMIAVLHLLQPDVFLSWRNVTNIFKQVSWQSMLALGVFMVIVTAGIDLSVGSIIMLSLMGLAIASKAGMPWYVVMLVAPAIGFLCGMFNGIGITLLRMPHPFIMTLGTLYIFRGIGNLISGGVPITGFAEQIRVIGNGKIKLDVIFGEGAREYIPTSLILMIVIFFIFLVFRGLISKLIIRKLEIISKRTTNKLDDTFVKAMDGPAKFLPIVLGFFFASYYISFSDETRSFVDNINNVRAAVRGAVDPGVRSNTIGFRVAISPAQ